MVEATSGDAHGLAAGIDDAHAALAAPASPGGDTADLPQRVDAKLFAEQAMREVEALAAGEEQFVVLAAGEGQQGRFLAKHLRESGLERDVGQSHFGIDAARRVEIPAARWEQLCKDRAGLQLDAAHGVVICDSLNLLWTEPKVQSKIAPEALPPAAAEWLKQLASAIEEAEAPSLAERLRRGIGQFAPR